MSRHIATQSEDSDGKGLRAGLTTAGVLRVLGAGANGAILMALGEGPLRTMELTKRVRGYTPRTVYRYSGRLTELGVIQREEEPGVPSKVVHSLTQPCGQELHDLVESYAESSLSRLPSGEIDAHAWGSLALLADLWESGMVDGLNLGSQSLTDLAKGHNGLSYHQVSRRTALLVTGGFVEELPIGGRRRHYALTEKTRRAMALIAGIGRWRRRHVVPEGKSGLTVDEAAGVLRTALPLVVLPEHGGKNFEMGVEGEAVWARVEADGNVLGCPSPPAKVDGRAHGKVKAWVDALLDGPNGDLRAQGDEDLIETCVSRLHLALWKGPEEQLVAAFAPAAPGG